MNLLVDTSILVRLSDYTSAVRELCERAIQESLKHGITLYLASQVIIEYWAVSTRPSEANGLGRSVELTFADCMDYLRLMSLLPEPPDIAERWLQLVRQYEVKGKEVHDARLVAFAVAHRIGDILTLNPDDFSRYREVTSWTPAQLMERMMQGG
jgi:predicted nucleic acid-binding protein